MKPPSPLSSRFEDRYVVVPELLRPYYYDLFVGHERLRAFLAGMERWIREGDVVRRKTLLREVYQEIRIWPKTATKPWTRKVFVAANLDALTRSWMVSPTGVATPCRAADPRRRV